MTAGVIHACPPGSESLTPCCGRVPFELPRFDRMVTDLALVTCRGRMPVSPDGMPGARRSPYARLRRVLEGQPEFELTIAGRRYEATRNDHGGYSLTRVSAERVTVP